MCQCREYIDRLGDCIWIVICLHLLTAQRYIFHFDINSNKFLCLSVDKRIPLSTIHMFCIVYSTHNSKAEISYNSKTVLFNPNWNISTLTVQLISGFIQ